MKNLDLKIRTQEEVVKFLEKSLVTEREKIQASKGVKTEKQNESNELRDILPQENTSQRAIIEYLEENLETQRRKLDELKLQERKPLKSASSVIISQETIDNITRDNLSWWADEIENGYVCQVLYKDFKNEAIVEKLNLLEGTVSYNKEELLLILENLKNLFEKDGFSAKVDITGEYCISLFANEKHILAFSRYGV